MSSSPPAVPPLQVPIGFNAQHSPMGAFMSFTCGHRGTGGGIGVQIGQPARQNLFVGVKDAARRDDAPLRCLPLFKGSDPDAEKFLVEQAGPSEGNVKANVSAFADDAIARHYGWATDTWTAEGLTFAIHTPFGEIPEPAAAMSESLRDAIAPSIIATLTVDNREGSSTRTGVFALGFPEQGVRLTQLDDDAGGGTWAFSQHGRIGFAATADDGPGELTPFQRWDPAAALLDATPVHQLGSCCGFGLEVPAGEVATMRIALGCYLNGVVTTGLEGSYLYTRCFASLVDVLRHALEPARFEARVRDAERLDRELLDGGLSADQQFLIAHATRSYYGSTQLLEVGGEPFWVVNEGEYCMMNTLDLSVDQVFWELEHNPWVVRNLLDRFVRHYSFSDRVKVYSDDGEGAAVELTDPDRDPSLPPPPANARQLNRRFELRPGGLSFTHDMGAHNNFSPHGESSYELPELTGCFSHMTQEQLCNWVLTAGCYAAATNDADWVRDHEHLLRACLESLNARRGDEPGDWMRYDSARCGRGSEITTYDSLDESLGQARNNLYIAVKRWASYAALRMMHQLAGLSGSIGDDAGLEMSRFPAKLAEHADEDGVLPAVAEPGNAGHTSRILSACEALIYPWYWSRFGVAFDLGVPETQQLVDVLRRHTTSLLADPERRNRFADGGLRLSSTSNNSWMSKIALFQQVTRHVLKLCDFKCDLAKADAAHVRWQTDGSAYWACCDQIVNGVARGSRYYPRIITAALWRDGH